MKQSQVKQESTTEAHRSVEPGYLVIVAGRPSTGKTGLILDLLANMAGRGKHGNDDLGVRAYNRLLGGARTMLYSK